VSDLTNRMAVVTGASRGIGAATAQLLRARGARVVGLARSLTPRRDEQCWDVPCDLTDAGALARAAQAVLHDWGAPDILVSNAGAFLLRPFEDTRPEDLETQIATNLRVPFAVAQAFLPAMRGAGGVVIHVGSVADHVGFPENAAYAASKFALRGLHETLVAEYRGSGIRFCLVSPGPTDTAAWDPVDPDHRDGFIPRARMLRPDDVAEAIAFVAARPPHVQVDWLRLGPA
jgi:NAD(P)-dependent dehydrogenase (short-subunit alcohol dehydrogenase family)